MKRGALFSLLSRKLKDRELVIVDKFDISQPKTKEVFSILKNLREKAKVYRIGDKGGRAILALPKEEKVFRASKNLPYLSYIEPRNLNIVGLLNNKYLILDKSSVVELAKTFLKVNN